MNLRLQALMAPLVAAVLAVAGCGKKDESAPPPPPPAAAPAPAAVPAPAPAPEPSPVAAGVRVVGLELGDVVDGEKRVSATKKSFAPSDTIHLAVVTEGSATNAVIAVKWTYQDGQVVKEDSVTIAPDGPARTVFDIAKPDGWPVGSYAVAVTLDGNPAGSLDFQVQ